MIKPKVLYIITFSIIFLVLIVTASYYIFFRRISADSIYGTKISEQIKQLDLNNDGSSEAVLVTNYKKGGENIFVLSYKTKEKSSQIELNGFESEANFCSDPFPKISSTLQIICLFGVVGAHSQNIELVRLSDSQIIPINFVIDSSKSDNISSDVPNFGFVDLKGDGNLYFFSDDRNYDLDPTLDSWRSYYYFKEGEFIFDSKIMLQSGAHAIDQNGKIN